VYAQWRNSEQSASAIQSLNNEKININE